jgi:OOP family OmpA-OmpF porin
VEDFNLSKLAVKATLVAILSFAAIAQAQTTAGYLVDGRNAPVKSGFGPCWRTGTWTPAMATAECDPELVKKEVVAAPMPKQAEPPAPPVAAPVPPPPAPKTITIAAKALFDFDKATLKPAAREQIDQEVVAKLAEIGKIKLIVVSGHTDRLGSAEYNQKLSERRAEAVKAYLVTKGLDGNAIETFGYGKTQPAQGVPKCADTLPRKKLIACLEPHRRVVIEIQGTGK